MPIWFLADDCAWRTLKTETAVQRARSAVIGSTRHIDDPRTCLAAGAEGAVMFVDDSGIAYLSQVEDFGNQIFRRSFP